jgi:Papain family cysteine protease
VPATKDLRADWWKIGDQGSTGSCVGWASADSVARWHLVRVGRIARTDFLSPRFVWMAAKETDQFTTRPTTFVEEEGTSLKAALDIARKYGLIRDALLPFATGKLYGGSAKTLYAIAAQLKILAYFNLGTNLTAWRTWLATKGPILTRLDVDDTWQNATATKGVLEEYKPDTAMGGHAVAFVGYRPGRFIVRNSWGTGWGDRGFGYPSLAYAQEAFTEAYGVEV